MQKMIKVRHLVRAVLALGVVTVGLIALAPASGASSSSSKAVTWAEQPTTTPNFILPVLPREARARSPTSTSSSTSCIGRCTGTEWGTPSR